MNVFVTIIFQASLVPLPGLTSADPEHKRVTRKHLLPEAFSHVEDRAECLALEYTPYCVEAPVDMRYPVRVARMRRHASLVFGVVVSAGADRDGLERTLQSISGNLRALISDGWQWTSIAVVVVVDGLECMSPSLAEYLQTSLRIFDASMTTETFARERVHLHVFERTVELPKHTQAREYFDPLQLTLAVTARQAGDMHAYQWLLNAFCQQLEPEFVITVAAGCKLQPKCARQLLRRFDRQSSAALVLPDAHIASPQLFNPVLMSQLFLSKYTAALSLPFSSAFGYVSPSSPACHTVGLSHCTGLRWKAMPVGALGKFFEGQERSISTMGPMAANM